MNPLLGALIGKVVDTVANLVDPTKKAEAELAILKLQQDASFRELDAAIQLAGQQTAVNAEEAKSEKLFKSGWRPGAGWVFVSALLLQFILRPVIETGYILYTGHALPVPLPTIDGMLWELGFGMLGLGTLRTIEKMKGVA